MKRKTKITLSFCVPCTRDTIRGMEPKKVILNINELPKDHVATKSYYNGVITIKIYVDHLHSYNELYQEYEVQFSWGQICS